MTGPLVASGAARVGAPATLKIRLDRIAQVFNTLDPYPFADRDLDPAAEDYLVGWAKEAPKGGSLRLEVLIPPAEAETPDARKLPGALKSYFAHRVEAETRELQELLRIGRIALVIGVVILAVCLLIARYLNDAYDHYGFASIIAEGLIIAGWVANWRPIEIFLYDWWPIVRRRRRFERLAEAEVAVIADPERASD